MSRRSPHVGSGRTFQLPGQAPDLKRRSAKHRGSIGAISRLSREIRVWAVPLSTLGSGREDLAASLVVASSALIAAKDTLNWRTGVQDEFAEKAKPMALAVPGAIPITGGVGLFVVGVFQAL